MRPIRQEWRFVILSLKLDFFRHAGGEVGQDSIKIDLVWIRNDAARIEVHDEPIHPDPPALLQKIP